MRRSIFILSSPVALSLFLVGCGRSAENTTTRGLQEENRVLREQIVGLEGRIRDLQAERSSSESGLKKGFEERQAGLVRDIEERQARMQQLHREKIAQLEGAIAGLRLELGAVQREKITLQQLVDRRPRLEESHRVRSGVAQTVLFVFLILARIMLVIVAARYRMLRDRMNQFVVQNASSYRVLGRSS